MNMMVHHMRLATSALDSARPEQEIDPGAPVPWWPRVLRALSALCVWMNLLWSPTRCYMRGRGRSNRARIHAARVGQCREGLCPKTRVSQNDIPKQDLVEFFWREISDRISK